MWSLLYFNTGHIIGRKGTGLCQIHDISHAKMSVSPDLISGVHVVSARGSSCEVGDALTVIGKRLARRRVRTPKKKLTGTSAAAPPVIIFPSCHFLTTLYILLGPYPLREALLAFLIFLPILRYDSLRLIFTMRPRLPFTSSLLTIPSIMRLRLPFASMYYGSLPSTIGLTLCPIVYLYKPR